MKTLMFNKFSDSHTTGVSGALEPVVTW